MTQASTPSVQPADPQCPSPSAHGWRRLVRWAYKLVRAVLIAWVVAVIVACTFENKFIYFPTPYPEGDWALAQGDKVGPPFVYDVEMLTTDGVKIHGWYCAPEPWSRGKPREDRPVILLLHGNAGNVTHRYEWADDLVRLPADVFMLDYRGYGKSQGSPDEAGVYLDSQTAWKFLTEDRQIDPRRIILLGESLGGAVAVDLASRVQPGGLVIQSSFTSIHDVVRWHYRWIPPFLIRTKMDSLSKLAKVHCPVLVIHGQDDEVISYDMGQRLFNAAHEPKTLYSVEGGDHGNLVMGERYVPTLREFLDLVGHEQTAPNQPGPAATQAR
ncbi:MAG: alpha/beta hydrolase [Phycisphaeraceae bacterium]|nr:alpha/beta hydrolase [Phycisphaeraceae bacterium]